MMTRERLAPMTDEEILAHYRRKHGDPRMTLATAREMHRAAFKWLRLSARADARRAGRPLPEDDPAWQERIRERCIVRRSRQAEPAAGFDEVLHRPCALPVRQSGPAEHLHRRLARLDLDRDHLRPAPDEHRHVQEVQPHQAEARGERKKTDVAIAAHMVADAYSGTAEAALLISGDSDAFPQSTSFLGLRTAASSRRFLRSASPTT